MTNEQAEYLKGLPLHRQLEVCQKMWGAAPTISLDIVEMPGGARAAAASAAVLNAILAAELGSPAPAICTRRLGPRYDMRAHIDDTLLMWSDRVEEALRPE